MTPCTQQINDNSNIVDSAPTSPGRSQSEPPTVIDMGREITASYPCESLLLKTLPKELKYEVIAHLDLPNVAVLKRTCSELCDVIEEGDVLAKAWYGRFSSAHRAQIKAVISTKDNNQLSDWLGQFTNDEALIKSVVGRRESDGFPAFFFFTISQLMSECKAFKLVEEGEISHGSGIKSASFSVDGRHVVTKTATEGRNTAKISGQDIGGSWDVKTNILHSDVINSATFSLDGHHLVTASDDRTAKIYAHEADGTWEVKVTITHGSRVNSAEFSPDGTFLVTASADSSARIYGQEANGLWLPKASISHEDSVFSASFSANGRYLITRGNDDKSKIYGLEDDGSWLEKSTIALPHDCHVELASLSPDGAHVLTVGQMTVVGEVYHFPSVCDDTVKIYGQKDDGSWEVKADIRHNERICSATFSPDGNHVVTASDDGSAQIYSKKADGSWERKANIRHQKSVRSATFSPDGRHVVTASHDKTVKIYGQNAKGVWKEKVSIAHDGEVNSAVFSIDGRHVVTACKDKTAKIIGQQIDGSWVVK
ncbi:F-box/WD repeat-containing protein, partial [Endozoicomonas sp. SESOKO2]